MDNLPDLRRWLDAHQAEGAELRLTHFEVKSLYEELQRLRQSNDRLRKQNRKVRKKVETLKPGETIEDLD